MDKVDTDVIIVGAGVSGLSCAKQLIKAGINFLILEGGNRIGGRIKSDRVDGFILDQGFQVLQTAYPEARRQLNYDKLELNPFSPGVAVRTNGTLFYISDPIRRPQDNGQKMNGKTVVIATEGPETQRLLKRPAASASKGERCRYFSAETPPIAQPFLILNGPCCPDVWQQTRS